MSRTIRTRVPPATKRGNKFPLNEIFFGGGLWVEGKERSGLGEFRQTAHGARGREGRRKLGAYGLQTPPLEFQSCLLNAFEQTPPKKKQAG